MGKEYITDADIKKDSFKIKEIRISQDLLHKEMIIPTENLNIEQIKDMVKVEMTSRREKLNKVAELLKNIPPLRRNAEFSPYSNNMVAIKILTDTVKQPSNLKDLVIQHQIKQMDTSNGFDISFTNKVFNRNNIDNAVRKLSQQYSLPYKTEKEISEMPSLKRFVYQHSIERIDQELSENPSLIPNVDVQKHSINNPNHNIENVL